MAEHPQPEGIAALLAALLAFWLLIGRRLKDWFGPMVLGLGDLLQPYVENRFLGKLREQQSTHAEHIKSLQAEKDRLQHELQVESARLTGLLQGHDMRMSEFELRLRLVESQSKEILSELVQLRREADRGLRNDDLLSDKLSEVCELVAGLKAAQTVQADFTEVLSDQISNLTNHLLSRS